MQSPFQYISLLLGPLTQGGPVMLVLFGFSVVGLALIIYKLLHFTKPQLPSTAQHDELVSCYTQNTFPLFRETCMTCPRPFQRIFAPLIDANFRPGISNKELEIELGRLATKEVRKLEEWLRPLAVIAQLAPLLGLLGTVLGMIEVFIQLERSSGGTVNPSILAGGIWEALLTTAFGLAIAIPASAAYSYFEGEVDNRAAAISDLGKRLLFKRRLILEEEMSDPREVDENLKLAASLR